jgi:hypothetical protein
VRLTGMGKLGDAAPQTNEGATRSGFRQLLVAADSGSSFQTGSGADAILGPSFGRLGVAVSG